MMLLNNTITNILDRISGTVQPTLTTLFAFYQLFIYVKNDRLGAY